MGVMQEYRDPSRSPAPSGFAAGSQPILDLMLSPPYFDCRPLLFSRPLLGGEHQHLEW